MHPLQASLPHSAHFLKQAAPYNRKSLTPSLSSGEPTYELMFTSPMIFVLHHFLLRLSATTRGRLRGRLVVSKDINVLALVKGEERYIFLFNEENRRQTLRLLGRYASNPDLSFTWYDAAIMSQKVRVLSNMEQRMDTRYNLTSTSDE